MGFQINTNIGALKAYNALAKLNSKMEDSQLKLSTQKRINNVADDTSGFNVGKSLARKVSLMQAARGNVGSAKDMLATAESQLINIKDMVTQVKSKIADASNPAADQSAIANDIKALGEEIANSFINTKFNNTSLLTSVPNGAGAGFSFQTGADASDVVSINYASGLVGANNGVSVGSASVNGVSDTVMNAFNDLEGVNSTNISTILSNLESFEGEIDTSLGSIGNYIQRLDKKDEFLTAAITNSAASVSRLFDADMAMEQLEATKSSIGSKAATSMLAQLNFSPQQILDLFG